MLRGLRGAGSDIRSAWRAACTMVATTPAVSAPEAPAMEPEVAPSTPDNLACAAERSGAATDGACAASTTCLFAPRLWSALT